MTSEDGSNGLKMDFDGLMGCEKLEIFLTDRKILYVVVRQSHHNYLGGVHL